jgi:type 2 lantibiotic biosynthesis protein LanM
VEAGISDLHHRGRSVIKLKFAENLELFYKPRPVIMEKNFNELLSWLNCKGSSPTFKVVTVLARPDYGWMEAVPHLPCTDCAAVERYYKRLGMLLCVLYALEATDCHYENVIACGEYPVLVDAETLLNPRVTDFFAAHRPNDPALQMQMDLLENTVLRTAFMPFKFEQQSDSYDFGALAQITEKEVEVRVRRWEHINTDGMKLYIENGRMTPGTNVPLLDGCYHDVKSYSGAFVEGFREGYRLISELKSELLNPTGPLTEFQNRPVRIIFRSTKVYGFILSKLTHPRYLRTGLERSLEIEALGHAFLLTETCPPLWHLLGEEVQAMEQDDIPLFLANSSSRDFAITPTQSVSNCFEDSGFNQVCKRIEQFSTNDLQKQLEVIYNSLRDYLQSNPERVTPLK